MGVEQQKPSLTFLYCVESGPLEFPTVLSIESLRSFGGRFAECPVVAVVPRLGPRLSRWTQRKLADLGAEYLHSNRRHRCEKNVFGAKPMALVAAQERLSTECAAFLDSDTLVLREPSELLLEPGCQYAACATDAGAIGSTGPDDPNDAYWQDVARTVGLKVDDFPWVTTEREGARIRFYINSGVMAYRADTEFALGYLQVLDRFLQTRCEHPQMKALCAEQVAAGVSPIWKGLTWRLLPQTYNLSTSRLGGPLPEGVIDNAVVLHYHSMLRGENWKKFRSLMETHFPHASAWFAERMPPRPVAAGIPSRVLRRVYSHLRNRPASPSAALFPESTPAKETVR